jgi:uncharacterized protein YgiM (DUF1202 family)
MKLFLLALFFSSLIVYAESAKADDKPIKLQIEASYIELHSGPGIGYPIVNVIEKGEFVEVLVKRTSWLKIKDQRNNIGWLNQNDLSGLTQQGEKIFQTEITLTDFQNRTYEAGVMYGDFEGSDFYNMYLGYILSPVFSAEISAGKALGEISDSDLYEVMLISQPFPELVVIPYIGVGGGVIKTKPHSVLADSENRQDTLMVAAIGVKYHLARNFLLRAEYKYSLVLTDRDENEEVQAWKLGFSVFF